MVLQILLNDNTAFTGTRFYGYYKTEKLLHRRSVKYLLSLGVITAQDIKDMERGIFPAEIGMTFFQFSRFAETYIEDYLRCTRFKENDKLKNGIIHTINQAREMTLDGTLNSIIIRWVEG